MFPSSHCGVDRIWTVNQETCFTFQRDRKTLVTASSQTGSDKGTSRTLTILNCNNLTFLCILLSFAGHMFPVLLTFRVEAKRRELPKNRNKFSERGLICRRFCLQIIFIQSFHHDCMTPMSPRCRVHTASETPSGKYTCNTCNASDWTRCVLFVEVAAPAAGCLLSISCTLKGSHSQKQRKCQRM